MKRSEGGGAHTELDWNGDRVKKEESNQGLG